MKKTNLSTEKLGILKGAFGASIVFVVGIGTGLYVLHQRHEKELDKLEKDTAITCLDFAAEHYEGVIRGRDRVEADKKASTIQSPTKMSCYEEFLEFQRTLDNAGKCEPTEEEWAEVEKKMLLQEKEYKELLQKIGEQKARADVGIDRLKLKLLAQKAVELTDKANCSEIQIPNIDSEEFQREIDATNNFEDSKE